MPSITVRGFGVEARGEHLLASFTLSATPSQAWVQCFRELASASVLNIAAATFQRNRLGIAVLDQKDLDVVIRAVEAMIDGVNFDVAFRQ